MTNKSLEGLEKRLNKGENWTKGIRETKQENQKLKFEGDYTRNLDGAILPASYPERITRNLILKYFEVTELSIELGNTHAT